MAVRIPVQSLARPVKDSIEGHPRGCSGGEQQRAGEAIRIGRTGDQVAVACQDAHVVAMLVERMLPPALTDDSYQGQLTGMHVRIAVVGLLRVLEGVVRVHVVW